MRNIASFLIALFAIMGIAAATVSHVDIISPQDGDEFSVGDTIKIRSQVSGSNEGDIFVRMLINDVRVRRSNWVPTEPGEYIIMVEAADNSDYTNSIKDNVEINVV